MERAHNPAILSRQKKGDFITKVDFERVKKLFAGELKDKQSQAIYDVFIKNRKVMQWGGLTEPFDFIEEKEKESLRLIKFFKEINYPIRICTKGARVLMKPEYIEAFRGSKNFIMIWTIITTDDEMAKKIEVNAPSSSERFKAMKFYHDELGIPQIIRIRPFIQGITSKCWQELIEKAQECGAEAISVEWLCIQGMAGEKVRERYEQLSQILGYDIFEYYKKLSTGGISYMRLNPKIKEKYVFGMRDLCHKLGMRFAISDPHFKYLNDTLNCCGLSEKWNWMQSPWMLALKIAKEKGVVYWSDIEKSIDWGKLFGANEIFISRDKMVYRKRKIQTIKDYIKTLWNTTKKQSYCPYLYFAGYLEPVGKDKEGNLIYKANKNFADL
jgi:DNA repair photolyase